MSGFLGDGDDLEFPVVPWISPKSMGRLPRPRIVDQAVRMWIVAAGCWLSSVVLGQLLGGRSVTLVIVVIVAVVSGGLIYALRLGANWSRILLTILGVLGELTLVFQLGSALTGSPGVGDIVQGLFGLGALGFVLLGLVMMYRRDAGPYFRQRR